MHNDLVRAADADQVTTLILLDLSSAVNTVDTYGMQLYNSAESQSNSMFLRYTVDYDFLRSVLERRLGVDGVALRWFQSYLQDRLQTFMVNRKSSRTHRVDCSVPQGSCLGPVEFITYTESVASLRSS